jgi:hypothetical protein
MAEVELNSLKHLIRSPDSHFLKVPELPFHVLVSVLMKFPADIDSRVFWSVALRDVLFDIMFFVIFSWNVTGMEEAASLKESDLGPELELLSQVFSTAVDYQGMIISFFSYISGNPDLKSM